MNGTEQRARHTAVQTAERRIDDVVTVLANLSAEILKDRERVAALSGEVALDRSIRETQIADLYSRLKGVVARQLLFESMSFWQRLKWLLTGEIA